MKVDGSRPRMVRTLQSERKYRQKLQLGLEVFINLRSKFRRIRNILSERV